MTNPHTLVHYIEYWAHAKPEVGALHGRRDGTWFSIDWRGYWTAVREIAKGLIALGHQPGQCVAMVGPNEPEWVQFQFGIQAAQGIPAPLYPTYTPEQIGYILGNSGAKLAVCADAALVQRVRQAEATGQSEALEKLLTFGDVQGEDSGVMSLKALRTLGRQQSDLELDRRLQALQPEETCLLIYTSGTTGLPKGVMLSHTGQLTVGRSVLEAYPSLASGVSYRAVSYLPLSHQAEQLVTNVHSLLLGGSVTFCPRMDELKEYLLHTRPTIFLGVPRVWEKFQAALEARLAETGGFKGKLASWARRVERRAAEHEFGGGEPVDTLQRRLARRLVVDKVKAGLGLDQLELAVTGAAPIGEETVAFFASLGIGLHDAYGMTETSGLASVTPRHRPLAGAVGKPLSCVEVRIAEDGEILVRGPAMTRGYWAMPRETAELFDADGWLQTGDLGSLGEAGYLRITGRKKELLITAGGKNVAPVELENHLKTIEGVGQAMVVGDRKPYLCALLTLDSENLESLARLAGIARAELPGMAADPAVRAYLQDQIEVRCNSRVARYQTLKKFVVLGVEWTPEGGEMTPTMKLRRGPTAEKYAAEIAGMYAEGAEGTVASP